MQGNNMNNNKIEAEKPVVLVFTGYYLPGYRAGGILRNIINMVDNMCDEFDFKIITRDRDLGDKHTYDNIRLNEWQPVGNASVYYLPPKSQNLLYLSRLIAETKHNVLYLSSYFDPLTIKSLFLRVVARRLFSPVIVAPFGEFAWASLSQKYIKKAIYFKFAKMLGLHNQVIWRVSSKFEEFDLVKVLGVNKDFIRIAGDFPIKTVNTNSSSKSDCAISTELKGLKIVFLSRIAREKNLDYAIRILAKVPVIVSFDIYGPAENSIYWRECQDLITQLPSNITVTYRGNVAPHMVVETFGEYDLFLFPTGGEAYGNVIAECISAGTPVLVSTETPWRNLESDNLGWDLELKNPDAFVSVISDYSFLTVEERSKRRCLVKLKAKERLFDPEILDSNRQLFLGLLN